MTATTHASSDSSAADAPAVLDFWFGATGTPTAGQNRAVWFRKDPAFDAAIRARFGALIERALRGELEAWSAAPRSALAQIIVLDQFTRNAFRDSARAYAGDARALGCATMLVGSRQDEALAAVERTFAYLPFEHCESSAMQAESMRLFTRLAALAPDLASQLDYARRHQAIIERYGRFPHRNAILGRQSTAEELEFLTEPGSGF